MPGERDSGLSLFRRADYLARCMSEAPQHAPLSLLTRSEGLYTFCAAAFAVVLVLTNIVGVKLFLLFPEGGPSWLNGGESVTLTSGIITYPLTFLLTDLVAEIWGKKRADLMVVLGFVMSLIMLGIVQLAIWLPPSPVWINAELGIDASAGLQHAFVATFFFPGILLAASMSAYLIAQLFDVRLYHFWWRVTRGRHMWLRNNGSTLISQLVDTIIVNSIFLRWGLNWKWEDIGPVIVAVYICKVVLALCDTPLIYLGRSLMRRYLGIAPDASPLHAPLEGSVGGDG